ncbi:hypothetical protein B0T26DRAFT_696575 [Lasiosphaeria miniovina]|uniref:Uncharacterized protein n=1 Tax=Lasiosphaeria miniovina TaxID=1954250 RepID=A0AA40E8L6_9PEZI|nr:uncharacterized protein B0T26DRAFT_696575 [Lasiosphaeria miniovina]KAK0728031.1 hypothetical protein B0T26DRAFT_696575 [Lasiosphaeria miniovina]
MPHKHTRREKDQSTFDLPPSQVARPLPVTSISKKNASLPKKNGQHGKKNAQGSSSDAPPKSYLKRKRADAAADDVPRAFKRLMAFAGGQKTRSGLDNGDQKGKKVKGKGAKAPAAPASTVSSTTEDLTIRPGERLSEFNQRVDAALPLSGLVKTIKVGKDPLGLKIKRTKKERKMHKMYDEWREEDRKIKEQKEEEAEEAEERELEEGNLGVTWRLDQEAQGKKKKGKKGKVIGESTSKEEDPWLEIVKKRGEAKVGIHDVAPPPDLRPVQAKLLVRGAKVDVENIPKSAGSLRQREELQTIRDQVVASYRKAMSERRPAVPGSNEETDET